MSAERYYEIASEMLDLEQQACIRDFEERAENCHEDATACATIGSVLLVACALLELRGTINPEQYLLVGTITSTVTGMQIALNKTAAFALNRRKEREAAVPWSAAVEKARLTTP